MHELAPVSGLYRPAMQLMQELDPCPLLALNVPAPHAVHDTAADAGVCCPAAHSVHATDPAVGAYCPMAQLPQALDPVLSPNLPAGQPSHDDEPAESEYRPAAQSSHSSSLAALDVPVGQASQRVAPSRIAVPDGDAV